jgi:hypothetical protein
VCSATAPAELHYSGRKWRWLAAHLAQHRPLQVVK